MSENAIDDAKIEGEGTVEATEPATEPGECGTEPSVEEAEHAIELAEELQQMTVSVGELENRVKQLENSIAVIVEAGATGLLIVTREGHRNGSRQQHNHGKGVAASHERFPAARA